MTRTNAAGILTVLSRAAALWVVVNTLSSIPMTARALAQSPDGRGGVIVALGFVMVVAIALWIFADVLAKLALARHDQPPFESDLDLRQWQSLAFSVIGMVNAVGGLVAVGRYVVLRILYGDTVDFAANPGVSPAAPMLQLAIGLALVFGANKLAGLVRPAPIERQ